MVPKLAKNLQDSVN